MATPLTQGVGDETIRYKKVTTLAVEEGMYVLMLSSPIITTADFNYLDHFLVHAESYNYVTLQLSCLLCFI